LARAASRIVKPTTMKLCADCGKENDHARDGCYECGTALPAADGLSATAMKPRRSHSILGAATALVVLTLVLLLISIGPRSRQFEGLQIKGNARFTDQVVSALTLLRDKSPEAYGIVTNHVGAIKQAKRSGMRLDLPTPTFELANPTAFYSLTWCAGSIAHDSFHAKLYHDRLKAQHGAVPVGNFSSQVEEEKQCLRHQLGVLREIGAPLFEIGHCAEQDGTHADVNKDGKYDWDDYNQGDW
jgi:hypothetical protein